MYILILSQGAFLNLEGYSHYDGAGTLKATVEPPKTYIVFRAILRILATFLATQQKEMG